MPIGPPSQRPEPKSACTPAETPIEATTASELAATGSVSTRSFHGFDAGNTGQRFAPGRRSACAAPTATSATANAAASAMRVPLTRRTVPRLPWRRVPRSGERRDARAEQPHRRVLDADRVDPRGELLRERGVLDLEDVLRVHLAGVREVERADEDRVVGHRDLRVHEVVHRPRAPGRG